MSQTATEAPAWQQQAADQLAEIGIPDGTTHVVLNVTEAGDAIVLALADSEDAGVETADAQATKVAGEVTVVPIDILCPLIGAGLVPLETETTTALADADTGADEDALVDGTASGPDADKGKLFEVPRIAISLDETDPTILKVAFSGTVELDRGDTAQAEFFNRMQAGKVCNLHLVGYVKSGPTNTHRRDSEGNVDAIVAQKSIVVTDVRFD